NGARARRVGDGHPLPDHRAGWLGAPREGLLPGVAQSGEDLAGLVEALGPDLGERVLVEPVEARRDLLVVEVEGGDQLDDSRRRLAGVVRDAAGYGEVVELEQHLLLRHALG